MKSQTLRVDGKYFICQSKAKQIQQPHRMRRYHALSVSRGRVAAKAYSIAWSLSPILRLMMQRDANEINTIGKLTLQRAHIIKQKCRQICLDITIFKIVVA